METFVHSVFNLLPIQYNLLWQLLYRKHVVFGKLVHGHEVLRKIENAGEEDGSPSVTVKIINSGEYDEGKVFIDYPWVMYPYRVVRSNLLTKPSLAQIK